MRIRPTFPGHPEDFTPKSHPPAYRIYKPAKKKVTLHDMEKKSQEAFESEGVCGIEEMPGVQKLKSRQSISSLGPPPDGGWLAWAQVAAGFFCSFNSPGLLNSFGVYQQFYATNGTVLAGETESRISWIGTLLGALSLIGASFFSILIDKGYGHFMAMAASVVSCFSFMMLSISTKYYQVILTQGVLTGISSSVLFCCGLSGVAPYFNSKRGIALGVVAVGSSLGGILYSVATQRLLYSLGFPWTCRITGLIILVTGVGTGSLFCPRVIPRKTHTFFASECLQQADWMFYCIGMFFAFMGFYVFYDYYQSYAYSYDPDEPAYVYMTAMLNVGSLLGRLVSSYLVDKIGIFNVLIPGGICTAILALCWMAAKNRPGIILVGVVYGCFSSFIAVAPGIVAVQLTPKDRMNRLGIILSFSFLFFGMGIVFGAPFAGLIVRRHGYIGVQLYCAFSWVVAVICFSASRQIQLRGKSFWSKC